MARSYTQRTLKLLWGRSAAHCAKCKVRVTHEASDVDRAVVLGEIAHIHSHSDDGPRAKHGMSARERDDYANLVLLCPTCHELVDKQDLTFRAERLTRWKHEHEAWVSKRLATAVPDVSFSELDIILKKLVAAPGTRTSDFTLTPFKEKLDKNALGLQVESLMQMGLLKSEEVRDFLEKMAGIDPDFPERLKSGFGKEYRRLLEEGYKGDELFFELRDFAALGRGDMLYIAAGLAVLVHLFELCEIFER